MSVNVLAIVSYCNNKFHKLFVLTNYIIMYNASNRVKRAIKLMSMSDTSRIRCLMPSYSVQRQLELSLNHCCRKAYYGYRSSLRMHTYMHWNLWRGSRMYVIVHMESWDTWCFCWCSLLCSSHCQPVFQAVILHVCCVCCSNTTYLFLFISRFNLASVSWAVILLRIS